jgi:glucose/arabinose dehydrogenase
MRTLLVRAWPAAALSTTLLFSAGCSSNDNASEDGGTTDASQDVGTTDVIVPQYDGALASACSLPGSIQFTNSGRVVVPGGMSNEPDLSFLKLPAGYCAHYYGTVGDARQLRFAPGGELFVASPTTPTTGGGNGGRSAIVILPDDNNDGYADTTITFLNKLPSTQGLMFVPGYFYYQNDTQIMVMPYQSGQRTASAAGTVAANFTTYSDSLHWPKVIDVADDGTIYFTNGGDQLETCDTSRPFHGGILKIDGSPGGAEVAKGLRNAIALRCQKGHNMCYALELALDYSGDMGGREKFIPVRQGDDWGFNCCATTNVPYNGTTVPNGFCENTATEIEGFTIGDTPFGLDFEPGKWPAPYTHAAFITLHGVASTWTGARLVTVSVDPSSGAPQTGNDLTNEVDMGGMGDFATGWDDNTHTHGRPAPLTFSADGRLFVGNDSNGVIFWIAPMGN